VGDPCRHLLRQSRVLELSTCFGRSD
jgi:hypothetical protein